LNYLTATILAAGIQVIQKCSVLHYMFVLRILLVIQ